MSSALDDISDHQYWVVVNMAHRDQRPRKERPGLRILAVFGLKDEADLDQYTHSAAQSLYGCNIWKMPIRSWFLLSKNHARQTDSMYTSCKIETLRTLYREHKIRRDSEFQKNRESRTQGDTDHSIQSQVNKAQEKFKKRQERQRRAVSSRVKALAARGKTTKATPGDQDGNPPNHADPDLNTSSAVGTNTVPSHLYAMRQQIAVVSWMSDITKQTLQGLDDPEPACIVWQVFDTVETARSWIKDVASKAVRNFDMEVVDMCQWLFPEDVDRDKLIEMHRNDTQDLIMNQKKQETAKVANFKGWCADQNRPVPVTEVVGDLMGPATDPLADLDRDRIERKRIKPLPAHAQLKAEAQGGGLVKTSQTDPESFEWIQNIKKPESHTEKSYDETPQIVSMSHAPDD